MCYQLINFGNNTLQLHHNRTLLWREENILVVSDLHLEKGSSYQLSGQYIPPYDTKETLERLRKIIDMPALTSENELLHMILLRNLSQQRTRKYFRLTQQLHKKIPTVCVFLENYSHNLTRLTTLSKESLLCSHEIQEFIDLSNDRAAFLADLNSFILYVMYNLKLYLANCEFVKLLVTLCLIHQHA